MPRARPFAIALVLLAAASAGCVAADSEPLEPAEPLSRTFEFQFGDGSDSFTEAVTFEPGHERYRLEAYAHTTMVQTTPSVSLSFRHDESSSGGSCRQAAFLGAPGDEEELCTLSGTTQAGDHILTVQSEGSVTVRVELRAT